MKRVSIFVIIATILSASMGSCDYKFRRTKLKTELDTLSYFYGWSRTEGIMNYLVAQAGVDTAYLDAFYKGFRDGSRNYSPKEVAYAEGMRIAHVINNLWIENLNNDLFLGDSSKTVNRQAVLAGFYNGIKHYDETKILSANTYCQPKIAEIKEQSMLAYYAESIAANEQFLNENKKKEGVKTTESGLQYKIIQEGKGEIPVETSKVKMNYKGTLIDGSEFESSGASPISFRVSQLIKGWSEALKMMPVGSKWELYIPHELAYGSHGQSYVPPFSTLIFELELVEIENQ